MEYLTLARAIDDLAAAGFVEHFGVSNGALRAGGDSALPSW
jgi:hypothetical protein